MTEYRLSRRAAEDALADAWKEVLGLPSVGQDESFFDVGGNSVRAIQLLTLVRERLDAPIELLDLFRFPTIRALLDTFYPQNFYPQNLQGPVAAPASEATSRAERCWRGIERIRQQKRHTNV